MARVILVRHGQTEWNREERFRGQIDVPLNDTGHWQAEQAARAIKRKYSVSAIYSSPLSRALRTAEAIGHAVGVPAQPLSGVTEFNYGGWEGKTPAEVAVTYPDLYRLWLTQPHMAQIPGGEGVTRFRQRVAAAVEGILADQPAGDVVLVAHRMVGRALACHLLGLSDVCVPRLELNTGSISVFEKTDEGWVTMLLNETCHLEADPVTSAP